MTEENIVYQILNVVRAEELNSDEVVDEREIRAFMRSHRLELITKYSLKGNTLQDICFQVLPTVVITSGSPSTDPELTGAIPEIVQLPNYFGTRLTTLEFKNIPLTENEDYHLSQSHPINKYKAKATIENQILKVFVGSVSPQALSNGISAQVIINSIRTGKVRMSAILVNTNDGINYDWTTSQYPLPGELIQEMKKNILRREFNFILATKSDQIGNMKNDTLKYYDQRQVQK